MHRLVRLRLRAAEERWRLVSREGIEPLQRPVLNRPGRATSRAKCLYARRSHSTGVLLGLNIREYAFPRQDGVVSLQAGQGLDRYQSRARPDADGGVKIEITACTRRDTFDTRWWNVLPVPSEQMTRFLGITLPQWFANAQTPMDALRRVLHAPVTRAL